MPDPEALRKGQIVKDDLGNHFLVIGFNSDGTVRVESVATRELFTAPQGDLYPTDRVAF